MLGIALIWLMNILLTILPVVLVVWIVCKVLRTKCRDYRFSQMSKETKADFSVLRKGMDRYVRNLYPSIAFREQDITNMAFRLFASGKPKSVIVEEYVRDLHDAEKKGMSYPLM